jgi:formylglycine-generating enzyme required for sulfatase activity
VYLNTFEVTVGRFRKFVEAYDGSTPPQGAGAHPLIAGSGWQSAWNVLLPASKVDLIAALKCDSYDQTWTDAPGLNERYAINCVDWYQAAMFCAWDGGRLPTEAEWEYASAGGDSNRLFPWGSEAPGPGKDFANQWYSDGIPFVNVGAHPLGAGRWGHQDLGGGMFEWVLDWFDGAWYSVGGNTCVNCANLTPSSSRSQRGGAFYYDEYYMRSAYRGDDYPTDLNHVNGLRCARSP